MYEEIGNAKKLLKQARSLVQELYNYAPVLGTLRKVKIPDFLKKADEFLEDHEGRDFIESQEKDEQEKIRNKVGLYKFL